MNEALISSMRSNIEMLNLIDLSKLQSSDQQWISESFEQVKQLFLTYIDFEIRSLGCD